LGQALAHGAPLAQPTRRMLINFFRRPPFPFPQHVQFALVLVPLHLHRVAHLWPR
jgi:hypothetical protein